MIIGNINEINKNSWIIQDSLKKTPDKIIKNLYDSDTPLSIQTKNTQLELDLENYNKKFITETKRIHLQDYPYAFNPSIIRWKKRILLSFRHLDDQKKSHLGLVWVDESMQPISPVQLLSTDIASGFEDVRLICANEKLYIVYSGTPNNLEDNSKPFIGSSNQNVRIRAAELAFLDKFTIQNDECFTLFDNENPSKPEKNWVPFESNGELLFSYSLSPHKVLRPIWGSGRCEIVSLDEGKITSQLGELRGGTPGIPLDDEKILSFFHTQKRMESQHSLRQTTPHYFMGAYLYSSNPPFEITHMSPEPIIGPGFYNGEFYEPHWHNVNVIFPGGFVFQESEGKKYIRLVLGRQDHEIWTAKIDVDDLLSSLKENGSFALPQDFLNKDTPISHYEWMIKESKSDSEKLFKQAAIHAMRQLEGWCSEYKASILMDLIWLKKPKTIVEIGVFGGKSLVPMGYALKALDNGGIAYGIDPWSSKASAEGQEGENAKYWENLDHEKILENLKEKISSFDLSNHIKLIQATSKDANPIQNIDILHIDGNHSDDNSYHDICKWGSLVRSGGMIIFDDITWETIDKALHYLNENYIQFRIIKDEGNSWGIWIKP